MPVLMILVLTPELIMLIATIVIIIAPSVAAPVLALVRWPARKLAVAVLMALVQLWIPVRPRVPVKIAVRTAAAELAGPAGPINLAVPARSA
jgi:hypothetical protein